MRVWILAGALLSPATAGRDSVLTMFATEARQSDAAFSGFSADRGRVFWTSPHMGGNPDTAEGLGGQGQAGRRQAAVQDGQPTAASGNAQQGRK